MLSISVLLAVADAAAQPAVQAAARGEGTALLSVGSLVALLTLTALEIVLGVDNVIVLAIVTGRLPEAQQPRARLIGLSLAMIMRVLLLLSLGWVMSLTASVVNFSVGDLTVNLSWRDLILLAGGLFLIWKSTREIHHDIEGAGGGSRAAAASFWGAITQIIILDLVFSLDSVITAIGMARRIEVMVAAVVIAVFIMMIFAGMISAFVTRHPSIKVLALSFLILVGVLLVADAFDAHLNRGYVYFAMGFSLAVESINIRIRSTRARPAASGG